MLSFMVRRLSSWPFFILLLTAITVLGTIIFFFSHYLGNRIISHDLALQRFETFETELANEEYVRGYHHPFELCQLSNTVLRGSESTSGTEGHSLRDAIILETYRGACGALRTAVNNGDHRPAMLKTQYWWGNKAIYAIGLRFLSLVQFRQMVEIATYLAYGILLAALAMLTPRAALAAVPVVIFGIFCSGVKYFTDVSNGVPYLWSVLAAAILSLSMKLRLDGFGPPAIVKSTGVATALFCFVAGMISSYLFFFDGHVAYTIALFGLVAWLGSPDQSAHDRAKRAALFIVFYAVGFVACFMLGQIVKGIALTIAYDFRFNVFQSLWGTANAINGQRPLIDGWSLFWTIGMGRIATGEALSLLSLSALVVAVSVAVIRGCRGRWDLLWDILFILVLVGLACLRLLAPNDILGRSSRYLFIIYGLMWSCLVLAVMKLGWRLRATIGGVIIVSIFGWFWVQSNRVESIRSAYERLAENNIIFNDHFKVYLDPKLKSLIYVRDECSQEDVLPQIFLMVRNVELGGNNREPQYDERRFWFEDYGVHFEGKCVAIVPLQPEYDIERIWTGQFNYVCITYFCEHDPWATADSVRITFNSVEYDSITGDEPLFSDVFDVYLGDGYDSLIYVKERCSVQTLNDMENTLSRFFLHVFPVNEEDLPEQRRRSRFVNVGFWFGTNGVFYDGRCVATVDLPDYDIAAIRTGQYILHEDQYINIWSQDSFSFGRISSHSAEYDSIVGDEPLFRDVFDVYLGEGYDSLIYVKERCRLQDAESGFFLHVFPVNEEDLPEQRRRFGFVNVSFSFNMNGVFSDGRCVATVDLPDYDIAAIRTGQYILHEDQYGNTWSRTIDLQGQEPKQLTD